MISKFDEWKVINVGILDIVGTGLICGSISSKQGEKAGLVEI